MFLAKLDKKNLLFDLKNVLLSPHIEILKAIN